MEDERTRTPRQVLLSYSHRAAASGEGNGRLGAPFHGDLARRRFGRGLSGMPWKWKYTVPLRMRSIFRRSQVERELEEELRFHLEAQIQHEIARGRTAEEARRTALRAMGEMERQKEACRDMRHTNLADHLIRDVRYAARTLARSPGFTTT